MAKAEHKTNVMRALEQKKIAYTAYQYPHEGGAVDGMGMAGDGGMAAVDAGGSVMVG